jgi:hypothetical protein
MIRGFLAAEFEKTPSAAEISSLLREFDETRGVRVQVAVAPTRGVVRQFPLPLLPKRQRQAAAIWEGQKLVPFPLKADETLYAFGFSPGPARNLQATLVAVPRADAAEILAAIEEVGWVLQGVSVSGAHRVAGLSDATQKAATGNATAVALWTPRRGSFMVFRGGLLQFQYDLGPPPDLPSTITHGQEVNPSLAAEWIKEMGRAIGDALEFYQGAYPQFTPERLELMGLPPAIAPLITDWQDHFGLPVVIVGVLERLLIDLPDRVGEWIRENPSSLTAAALAASGCPAVDLTPPALVTARQRRVSSGIARGAFILSVAAILAWTGLLWMRMNLAVRSVAGVRRELVSLRSSSPAKEMERGTGVLRNIQALSSEVATRPQQWMPWAKSMTSTIPSGADLASIGLDLPENVPPGISLPMVRMEGRLDPSSRAHSLIYADWINRLDHFAGNGAARLVSTRATDWHGQRSSAFVIEVFLPGFAQGAAK